MLRLTCKKNHDFWSFLNRLNIIHSLLRAPRHFLDARQQGRRPIDHKRLSSLEPCSYSTPRINLCTAVRQSITS